MAFRIIADSSCDIFDIDNKPAEMYFNTAGRSDGRKQEEPYFLSLAGGLDPGIRRRR